MSTNLITPLTISEPGDPSRRRRIAGPTLKILGLLSTAAAILLGYRLGLLGPALGVLLMALSLLTVAVTGIRLIRRRAHLGWLTGPWRSGERRFGAQFLVRTAFWLTAAHAATLAFPQALTGADEAAWTYALVWAAAVLGVLAGLAPARRVGAIGLVATGLAVLALILQLVQIHAPARDAVTLQAPLQGTWIVGSGGRSGLLSHHFAVPQQRDALDLIIPFARRSAQPPTDLADYPAYGKPISAPADGTVVAVVDRLPDQPIGRGDPDPAHVAGNHVVVDLGGGRFLLLAHLEPGSITVEPGVRVRRGERLGAVGNSGNTTEPHLHVQVQTGPRLTDDAGVPTPGLTTFPITFAGAERDRSGVLATPAADLRTNDRLLFR